MAPNDYAQAADIGAIKGSTLSPGRALSPSELTALMAACSADPTPAGPRDAALIGLLSRGGLRRSEAVALDLTDYVPESGAATVRSSKGCKDRTTYLDGGAAAALVATQSADRQLRSSRRRSASQRTGSASSSEVTATWRRRSRTSATIRGSESTARSGWGKAKRTGRPPARPCRPYHSRAVETPRPP
jgi:site-specific recombinase XerD